MQLAPEHERVILTAIDRLRRFAETVETARESLTADLRLPLVQASRYHAIPGGRNAP